MSHSHQPNIVCSECQYGYAEVLKQPCDPQPSTPDSLECKGHKKQSTFGLVYCGTGAKCIEPTPDSLGECKNCGMDIAIRNPSGHCDHLYYPENLPEPVMEPPDTSLEKCVEHGICKKHGRVMLHKGPCHDCRNEKSPLNTSPVSAEGILEQFKDMFDLVEVQTGTSERERFRQALASYRSSLLAELIEKGPKDYNTAELAGVSRGYGIARHDEWKQWQNYLKALLK